MILVNSIKEIFNRSFSLKFKYLTAVKVLPIIFFINGCLMDLTIWVKVYSSIASQHSIFYLIDWVSINRLSLMNLKVG